MSQNDKSVGDEAKQRRSPVSPMLSIDEAIKKARLIYAKDKRAFTDFKTLAGHLGYTVEKKGGRAGRTASTLKQYGLLDERAGQFRISDMAWKILEMPEDSPERAQLVKKAALSPPMIRKILKHYDGELPSDATLRSHLLFTEKFNTDSATDFIKVLRRTIELVKPSLADYNAGEESEGAEQPPTGVTPMQQPPPTSTGQPSGRISGHKTLFPLEPEAQPIDSRKMTELAFKLSRGSDARVTIYGDATQEAIAKLTALLELSQDTFPTQAELTQPRAAIWRNKDHDQPVKVIGEAGEHDGRRYLKIEGSDAGVPEEELEFTE